MIEIKSRSKKLKMLALFFLACGAIAFFLYLKNKDRLEQAQHYETSNALIGSIRLTILSSGQLKALSTIEVGSEISGEIIEVPVNFNEPVKKGQILARINPTRYLAQHVSAKASLAISKFNEDRYKIASKLANADVNRKHILALKQLISRHDLEEAEDSYAQANAALQSAKSEIIEKRASLSSSIYDLKQTIIRSPVDGIVLERLIEPGQTVAASLQTPVLFKIAEDLKKMLIELSVNEADVGKIKVGNPVTFNVDAFPDRLFVGQVQQIRYAPKISGNIVTYPVIVAVDNPDTALIPGMTANAEIESARRDRVLRIPVEALTYHTDEAKTQRKSKLNNLREYALSEETKSLRLNKKQVELFNAAMAAGTMTTKPQKSRVDSELVNFFGPQMAGKIVVLDASGVDPAIAKEREWLTSAKTRFFQFRSQLNPSQKSHWDKNLEAIASSGVGEVTIINNSNQESRPVLLGLSDGDFTEIIYGLKPGEKLITSNKNN